VHATSLFLRGIKLVHTRAVLCFFFEEVCFTKNTEIDFARLNRWQLFPSISVAARHTERGPDLTDVREDQLPPQQLPPTLQPHPNPWDQRRSGAADGHENAFNIHSQLSDKGGYYILVKE